MDNSAAMKFARSAVEKARRAHESTVSSEFGLAGMYSRGCITAWRLVAIQDAAGCEEARQAVRDAIASGEAAGMVGSLGDLMSLDQLSHARLDTSELALDTSEVALAAVERLEGEPAND